MRKIIALLGTLSLAFFLGGCMGGPMQQQATTLNVNLSLAPGAQTTTVYLFALTSNGQFKRLDYFELMRKKSSGLNGEIASQSRVVLVPGSPKHLALNVGPNVRYFALAAAFPSAASNDKWHYSRRVHQGNNTINLIIGNGSIRSGR